MADVTAAATFCATLADEWASAGVTDAVVCPGSRSTPLAVALHAEPRIRVHVFHDERSGAFAALGLARGSGRPALVLTTSGTATANLYPAIIEADEDAVPLIACTADRPPELHGVGAPQSTDQRELYGRHTRLFVDAGVPDERESGRWRGVARSVLDAALGGSVPPGPVQLNLPFREPLLGVEGALPVEAGPVRRPVRPRLSVDPVELAERLQGRRGVIVTGGRVSDPGSVVAAAERLGWPVLAGPVSGCRYQSGVTVRYFDLLARVDLDELRPDAVLRLGRQPASRALDAWMGSLEADQIGVDPWGRRYDPTGSLGSVIIGDPGGLCGALATAVDPGAAPARWLARWVECDEAVAEAFAAALDPVGLSEPGIARTVLAAAAPAEVMVASSMPIRDVEWYGGWQDWTRVTANRGANGIDGVVSTAVGIALARSRMRDHLDTPWPTVCLLGDLAFLHDSNGLIGLAGRGVDLVLVVVDNDGGGIFSFLPQRDDLPPADFEELFGTPHGAYLQALAGAFGVAVRRVDDLPSLREAIEAAVGRGGVQVLIAHTDREENRVLHGALHDAARAALG